MQLEYHLSDYQNRTWLKISQPHHTESWLKSPCLYSILHSTLCFLLGAPDQINPLLVSLWIQQSGLDHLSPNQPLIPGPDHPSSGQSLDPTVGTRSSLFWCTSEAHSRDQIITLLVCFWILWSGLDHPSSGMLQHAVGNRFSLFWCATRIYGQDKIISLLVILCFLYANSTNKPTLLPLPILISSYFLCPNKTLFLP